jgi:hypothetical protein
MIVDKGADVNAIDSDGKTALVWALEIILRVLRNARICKGRVVKIALGEMAFLLTLAARLRQGGAHLSKGNGPLPGERT